MLPRPLYLKELRGLSLVIYEFEIPHAKITNLS